MRVAILLLSLLSLLPLAASAQPTEEIVLTGGPALRFMEHGKAASHDFYWFNFVDASAIRLKQLKEQADSGTLITWLVFRPSYISRSHELGINLLPQIESKARALGVNLLYFDTSDQVINYLNQGKDRARTKIADFDYIGHSNKACFLFDYSNQIDTMSVNYLHANDLKRIDGHIFTPTATCKSWGCHSGELYSQSWKTQFSVPMIGAVGKTDFSHGGLPVLSNADGKWVE